MKLTNQNIEDTVEKIQKFFETTKITRKDAIRVCLLLEESLIRYQEKFGEDYDFNLVIKKWFGTPKIFIKIKGKPYNPLDDESEEQIFSARIMQNLLSYEKAEVIYRYENGYNEIAAFSTKDFRNFKSPGGAITILIFSSFLTAFIISQFPQQAQDIIVFDVVTPILNTLIGTLIAVNLPLIFISIVASICSIEDIAMLNELGTKILLRFMAIMFSISFLSIFVCSLFFPVINFEFEETFLSNNLFELRQLFNLILSIFPQDIFKAFIDKNILQVMVLAFITGICVTMLGNRVVEFKNLIMNLKQIIFKSTTQS